MSFLSRIFNITPPSVKSASATKAKERLSLIIAHQRGSNLLAGVNVQQLQADVMKIVQQHISIAKNEPITFNIKQDGQVNLFEMQIQIDGEDQKWGAKVEWKTNSISCG